MHNEDGMSHFRGPDMAAPEHQYIPKGVGDVTSNNRGTAARYNSGKARVDLLPLYMVVDSLNCDDFNEVQLDVFHSLRAIAEFQRSGEERYIDDAMQHLSKYWLECADVFGYGAKKYAPWNWVKGMAWSVPIGCIGRHSFAVFRGEMNDPESTLPHVGHILCNVVMLKAYFTGFPEGNDLPPKGFKV